MSVLIATGSVRGNTENLFEDLNSATRKDGELDEERVSSGLSNSEVLALSAAAGARMEGAEVEHLNLRNALGRYSDSGISEEAIGKVDDAEGLILATPVYFGDRSSYVHSLFQELLEMGGKPLEGTVAGSLSVGAKRNGGQETANIYALLDASSLGAMVVGNGPPTAQYGGTGWAGDRGEVSDDNFGLMTARGTGRRVAEISELVSKGGSTDAEALVIDSTGDCSGREVRDLLASHDGVETSYVDVSELVFERCRACSQCPAGDGTEFKCIVPPESDDMGKIHEQLTSADGYVFVGKDSKAVKEHQALIERTRYLRRDDFKLQNRVFTAVNTGDEQNPFHVRVLTSFIRQNTVYVDASQNNLKHFVEQLRSITEGRSLVEGRDAEYVSIGYEDETAETIETG